MKSIRKNSGILLVAVTLLTSILVFTKQIGGVERQVEVNKSDITENRVDLRSDIHILRGDIRDLRIELNAKIDRLLEQLH